MTENQLKIKAEPALDPDVCKFLVDREILPGRSLGCKSREMAAGSPLFEALFAIEGVREALVSGYVITVAKETSDSWQILGKNIGAAIRNAFLSGKPLIPVDWETKEPDKGHLFKEVEAILASRVNPGVASHGRVELVDVKGSSVYLRLSGGCQGCGAANVTLRQGIEKAIRAKLPEVTEVVDVTDHSSGRNPYYKTQRTDGSPL